MADDGGKRFADREGKASERIVLRRLRPEDWARQRDLRLEMLADTPIAYLEALETARARPDVYWEILIAGRVTATVSAQWVLDAGDRHVGTMSCVIEDDDSVQVVAVYLAPAYRGRGFLARMLAEVAEWAHRRGVTTLTLNVAQENGRAVEAYRKLGFVPTGRTFPHPLYPQITEVEMSRAVNDGTMFT